MLLGLLSALLGFSCPQWQSSLIKKHCLVGFLLGGYDSVEVNQHKMNLVQTLLVKLVGVQGKLQSILW